MATIQEVEEQIRRARERLQQEKERISHYRTELSKAEEQKRKAKEKLPKPTARTLRLKGGLFEGLEGRKRRRIIEKMKETLSADIKKIGSLKEELKKEEQEKLIPFEKQIEQEEARLQKAKAERARIERYNQAVRAINKLIARNRWDIIGLISIFGNEIERKLAKEVMEEKRLLREQRIREMQKPELGVETTFVNPKTGLGYSMLPEEAKKLGYVSLSEYKLKQTKLASPKIFLEHLKVPREISRTVLLKDFKPIRKIDFGRSSFKDIDIGAPFRTTGSPIRITGLTSMKSRGYYPYPKLKQKPIPKPKIVKPEEEPSLLKKPKEGIDFLFGKKKKKSKKKKKKSASWI